MAEERMSSHELSVSLHFDSYRWIVLNEVSGGEAVSCKGCLYCAYAMSG
jgi:hypothetical protein